MAVITTDQEFKQALGQLTAAQQRALGARFVERVIDLNSDPRVRRAVAVAADLDAVETELDSVNRDAKTAAVESYTACGQDTDWSLQAAHFVATAAADCSVPPSRAKQAKNAAWDAAMYARMARTCEKIARGEEDTHDENGHQYALAASFVESAR